MTRLGRARIDPIKMKIISRALRRYEVACEQMWDDMVWELHMRLKLKETTVDKILVSL